MSKNLRELRERRNGMSTYTLSKRLEAIGWATRPTAITKMEHGDRRLDVDDLIAMSIVFGTSPNAILFPHDRNRSGPPGTYLLTPACSARSDWIWKWATGDEPLTVWKDGEGSEDTRVSFDDGKPDATSLGVWQVDEENKPHKHAGKYRIGLLGTTKAFECMNRMREPVFELIEDQGPDYARQILEELIFDHANRKDGDGGQSS